MKFGHDAAVVELHARAVGVEDADDAGIDFVIAVVGHGDGLGEALGFVVDGARADGIHVAPVGFFLRMLQRIAVALGSGRDEIFRAVFVRDVERVKSSERADFQRGDAVNGVVDGTGGAGEVKNVIDVAHVEGFANVFFYKLETRIILQMGEVGAAAGEQVVDDNDAPAFGEQGIAEMGSEKSGAAGDQRALRVMLSCRSLCGSNRCFRALRRERRRDERRRVPRCNR